MAIGVILSRNDVSPATSSNFPQVWPWQQQNHCSSGVVKANGSLRLEAPTDDIRRGSFRRRRRHHRQRQCAHFLQLGVALSTAAAGKDTICIQNVVPAAPKLRCLSRWRTCTPESYSRGSKCWGGGKSRAEVLLLRTGRVDSELVVVAVLHCKWQGISVDQ